MNEEVKMDIKRGDIYWILYGEEGSVMQAHRPGLIVSSDKGNETAPWVMFVPLTSTPRWGVISPEISATGKRSWAKCTQVTSVDKVKLGTYMCTVSEKEMAAVDLGMRVALSLLEKEQESNDESEEEIRMLKEEIASLNTQIAKKKDDDTGIAVERDMYKRMYEKAIEMLVGAKMATVETPKVEEPVVVEPEVFEEEPTPPAKIEINSCTAQELRDSGCSPTVIKYIIAHRPYSSVEDLKAIPQLTRFAYQILEKKVCCIPPMKANVGEKKDRKLNVNTAEVEDFTRIGMGVQTAAMICAYRKKCGDFSSVEDLLAIPRFGKGCMKKFGSMLEV